MPSKTDSKSLPSLTKLISLKGKKALITGSASGIGKAMAYRFAEAGADLQLVDINQKTLEDAREELEGLKREVRAFKIDLGKREGIDGLWKDLEGEEPDILVNNAGIYPSKPFLEVDEAFLRKVMDVNLYSTFWMCQHMIRARLKKGGVIINVGSIEAIMPLKEDLSHYDISKAGVMVLTRALASEYGKDGFRINVLVPGGVLTPGAKNVAKDVLKLRLGVVKTGIEYAMRTPLGRLGKPDEIARMALVLASDLATYVQGTLITVDGGFLSA